MGECEGSDKRFKFEIMITKSQKNWLEHLSDSDKIIIKPYDPKSPEIFEEVKEKVIGCLGEKFKILHRGASYLKISGQDEIDIYVPVSRSLFDQTVSAMKQTFGEPRSLYPLKRARFRMTGYKKHIDVFVINKEDKSWIDSEEFTSYLLSKPQVLEEYRALKEFGNGLSVKAYYTRKNEFINRVLGKMKNNRA